MLNLSNRNLLVVDFETTGLNPFRHDALSIGLVPVNESLPSKEVFISHDSLLWNEFARENFQRFKARSRAM
jgi:DNA polymerase III subunit epsilon